MNQVLSGMCACGSVKYVLRKGERSPIYACHCTDCQTRTGSAFSEHMLVRYSDLEITGLTDQYDTRLGENTCISFVGCPVCRVRIYAANNRRPGHVTLRCGTLDQSVGVEPSAHFWLRSKQPWVMIPSGQARHNTQPEYPFEWLAAFVVNPAH